MAFSSFVGSTNLVQDIHDKIKETAFQSSSSPLFLSSRLARFAGEKQRGDGECVFAYRRAYKAIVG